MCVILVPKLRKRGKVGICIIFYLTVLRDVDNVRETKSLLLRTTPNASSRGHLKVVNTVETHNMH
jgi:hypothetical protein